MLANRMLYNLTAKHLKLPRMGTTVVLAKVDQKCNVINVYHVGDIRLYRIRKGQIEQLTKDYSRINDLLYSGKIKLKCSKIYKKILFLLVMMICTKILAKIKFLKKVLEKLKIEIKVSKNFINKKKFSLKIMAFLVIAMLSRGSFVLYFFI